MYDPIRLPRPHSTSPVDALMTDQMEDWEQSDTLLELARAIAGTPAAAFAAPKIEEVSLLLSAAADDMPMRNKFRVYEFRGVAAAVSPAGPYTDEERRDLFAELIRLHAMPDNTEVD